MFVVIRLRGRVKMQEEIKDTLAMLRLHRKMHAVLLDGENASINGMIHKVKDWITWGEISDDMLKKMILKRGRKTGNKKLDDKEADDIFSKIKAGSKLEDIKPVFRFTPPSKGFKKSIKQQYPNGELGYRGDKINELVKRMI